MNSKTKRAYFSKNNFNEQLKPQPKNTTAGTLTPAWIFKYLYISVCVITFIYVVIRCFTLSLTCDEWGLILSDVQQSLVHLLIQGHKDVQSTFLLVLLSKFVAVSTSNMIFAIRLPSALSLLLYLWASYKITLRIRPNWVALTCLLALCANAYMLDFFSIGRGYSLALAFQMLSLYFFIRALAATHAAGDSWRKWCVGAVWSASFSVLAIVAFLNFYFAMLGSCLILGLSMAKRNSPAVITTLRLTFVNSLHLFYNAALLGIFYLPRILILNMHNCFYAGGDKGLIRSTIYSLVEAHFYMRPPGESALMLLSLLVWGVTIFTAIIFGYRNKKTTTEPSSKIGIYISVMLAIMALFHTLLFYATGTLYPIMRAALCFFPLFILNIVCFTAIPNWVTRSTGAAILAVSIIIGLNGINLHRTQTYHFSAQDPKVIEDIATIHKETGHPVVLGVTDRLKYTLWWYAEKQLNLKQRSNPEKIHDGLMRCFDWLTIYTLHYGQYRLFSKDSTHILLDMEEMTTNDIPQQLVPLHDYPIANIRLYQAVMETPITNALYPSLSIIGQM